MTELFIPLFHHWGILQYAAILLLGIVSFATLYGWAWLWNRCWPPRNWRYARLWAGITALCAGVIWGHATIAKLLVNPEKGQTLLKKAIEEEPGPAFALNMYRVVQKKGEACVQQAIPTYVSKLVEQHPGAYLPLKEELPDWQPNQHKEAESAILCVRGYAKHNYGINSWQRDSNYRAQCTELQNACSEYLAEQQYEQNKEQLEKWAECYSINIFLLTLLPSLVFVAHAAYRDIAEIRPIELPAHQQRKKKVKK